MQPRSTGVLGQATGLLTLEFQGKNRKEAEDGLRYGKTHYAKVKMLKVLWLLLMMMLYVIYCILRVWELVTSSSIFQ